MYMSCEMNSLLCIESYHCPVNHLRVWCTFTDVFPWQSELLDFAKDFTLLIQNYNSNMVNRMHLIYGCFKLFLLLSGFLMF